MKEKLLKLENIAVLSAAIILFVILILKPIIGIADNGDFGRIMGETGLDFTSNNPQDKYFGYVNREFLIVSSSFSFGGYFSSEILLVQIAKIINNIFNPLKGIFDIRFLALLYCAILLFSFYHIIKRAKLFLKGATIVFAILLLLFFTDVGYTSYFNTFYGEPVSFVSFFLICAFALILSTRKPPPLYLFICFLVSVFLLVAAKAQNAPIGIIMSLFVLGMWRFRKDKIWRATTLIGTLMLLLLSVQVYSSVPEYMKLCNKYQSVFYGILKDSNTPEKDLAELGLDKKLSVLASTNYFQSEYPLDIKSPEVIKTIEDKISPLKVAAFYLQHPTRYIKKLEISASNGFKLIQGFGNYEKGYNVPYNKTTHSFRLWSDFKEHFLPHSLTFIVVLFLLYYIVLIRMRIKAVNPSQKIWLEFLMSIGLIGVCQFLLPIVGDGEADLSKHLFLFNLCFDVVFLICIMWTLSLCLKQSKRLTSFISLKMKG